VEFNLFLMNRNEMSEAAFVVKRRETDSSADLGGSSKYSNEKFED